MSDNQISDKNDVVRAALQRAKEDLYSGRLKAKDLEDFINEKRKELMEEDRANGQ